MGNCSSVVILRLNDRLGFAVSVLGSFMGFISVPANLEQLKDSGQYAKGHCIYIQDSEVKRLSAEDALFQRFGDADV